MWLLYTLLFSFFLALVNYIDEYLTANNALPATTDIHTKVGGLIIVSTLFTVFGATVVWFFAPSLALDSFPFWMAILSGVPMAALWAGYFYLLNIYPVYQVIPLFQMSSIWLLIIELITGGSITLIALTGVAILIAGAYLLDAGTLRWQIPTKLLIIMIPVSFCWTLVLFMVRLASNTGASSLTITFWQFVGIASTGVLLFLLVRKYREGFLFRVRHQGKNFLGFSLLNEGSGQAGYYSGNIATALVPLATYFSALGGLQSVLLLVIFYFFPQKPLSVNSIQVTAICMIAVGIFLLEGWKYV
jgi:hypothetical protein